MNAICFSSFMYADDLILLSPSRTELIRMINIVCDELKDINLSLNCEKSCYIRVGPKHAANSNPITTNAGIIPWVKEARYLGITIENHRSFKVSFNEAKSKFYAAFNNLYSKLGNRLDINVLVHLVKTMVLPIITYAIEALNMSKSCVSNLEFCFNRIMFKIFKVNDGANRLYCMKAFDILSIEEVYKIRKEKFLEKIKNISNINLKILCIK